jgi:twitching motility protein PilT
VTDSIRNAFGLPLAAPRTAPAAPPAAPFVPAAQPVAQPVARPVAQPAPAPVRKPLTHEPVDTGLYATTALAPPPPAPRVVLDDLLIHVLKLGGSDLHLTRGAPPTIRLRGEMQVI